MNDYDLSLLTPNKITVNHLLTMSPIFADLSDAFGHILLYPETALSCQIFLFKSTEDSLPTLDLSKAELDENEEPILYPFVYSSSSFGTKDLPIMFSFAMTQCVKYFKQYSTTPLKNISKSVINVKNNDTSNKVDLNDTNRQEVRLNMVDKILCAAYVDDLSFNEFRTFLVTYFIQSYN